MRIVQEVRWNTAVSDSYIGPAGQITGDTDRNDLRYHDGVTPGGNRIPNYAAITGFGVLAFTAVVTSSVPATPIPASAIGKFTDITVAGAYTLPTLAGRNIGDQLIIQPAVAGVTIAPVATQFISDLGVDQVLVALTQYRVVRLAVKSVSQWVILSKY